MNTTHLFIALRYLHVCLPVCQSAFLSVGLSVGLSVTWRISKWMHASVFNWPQSNYHSLTKEQPPLPPILAIFSAGVKMSTHPKVSLVLLMKHTCEVWEAQPQVLCISEVRNFVLYITEGYYNVALRGQTASWCGYSTLATCILYSQWYIWFH